MRSGSTVCVCARARMDMHVRTYHDVGAVATVLFMRCIVDDTRVVEELYLPHAYTHGCMDARMHEQACMHVHGALCRSRRQ